ncbi:MAG: glycosyltransferase [Candidatus Marinimicrobia bacterium]|nr:glycosyltransferase [Candidatus Neomarinimicrobiota bacterium]
MSQKLNIGFILPASPAYSETFIINKLNGLIQSGFHVSLFVGGRKKTNEIPKSIPVYFQVDINYRLQLFYTFIAIFILHPIRFWRLVLLERASNREWDDVFKHLILNAHILGKSLDWIHFGFATMGIGRENLASAMNAKSAVSFRGYDIGLYPHQHPDCYNLLWGTIDKVHTISDDLYQRALNLGLNSKTPFEKITPAINTEFFNSIIQEDLHNPLRILTVGRLAWKKGFEYCLKSLQLLKIAGIKFEYRIVGEGEYKEAIMYALHQLNLTKNVLLTGKKSPDIVKQELEWADIYIQPSIQEGFCNAVLEAQAMGILCIVTNAEGLSENVLDGKTGWVVEKRNPIAIYERIINIIGSENIELNEIRKNAVNRVDNKFNIEKQNKLFKNFYLY